MTIGRWIAYAAWILFFGVLARVVAAVIASKAFGIGGLCLFSEETDTGQAYNDAVGITLLFAGLALVAYGPAFARRSATLLVTAPLAGFAAIVIAAAVAAASIGEQPCT